MARKFLRTDSVRFSRLGKGRKKLQKWRAAKGRDNKIRERRFSYPVSPRIGYKKPKSESGKIYGKDVLIVRNLDEVKKASKACAIIIGKVGAKKRIEMIKKADERGLHVVNVSKDQSAKDKTTKDKATKEKTK